MDQRNEIVDPIADGGNGGAAGPEATRPAYSPTAAAMVDFAVYDRAGLTPGMRFDGPAIVEEETSTTVIDMDGRVEIDRFGSLVITLQGDTT